MRAITVSNLKHHFLTRKLVEARYAGEIRKDFAIQGMQTLKTGRCGVKLSFDSRQMPTDAVLPRLTEKGSVMDLTISDPPLEEAIARIDETAEDGTGEKEMNL